MPTYVFNDECLDHDRNAAPNQWSLHSHHWPFRLTARYCVQLASLYLRLFAQPTISPAPETANMRRDVCISYTKTSCDSKICAIANKSRHMPFFRIGIRRLRHSSLMSAPALRQYEYRLCQSPSWTTLSRSKAPKKWLILRKEVRRQLSVSKFQINASTRQTTTQALHDRN